jgi:hypothetical protein
VVIKPNFAVWVIVGFAWLWFVVAVESFTGAGYYFPILVLLFYGGVTIGVVWVIMSFKNWTILWKSARKRWLSVPLVGVLGFVLAVTQWGFMARTKVSEDRLRTYVEAVRPGTSQRAPQWVGLFRVEETEEYEGAVYLYTGHAFINRVGLAYMPPGAQPPEGIGVKHLFDDWYTFEWRF